MTHTGLASRVFDTFQKSSRQGATIDTILWHHQAGTNSESVIAAMRSGARQVSANCVITNEGEIVVVVDEDWRAWTSGSSTDGGAGARWDRRSLTVEIENEAAGGSWPISAAAIQAAAKLRADWRSRYPISQEYGHRDLWNLFRASYPTFCPGPDTVARIQAADPSGPIPAPAGGGVTPPTTNYGFGLTSQAQLAAQQALARLGRYSGDQDGIFGSMSVSAMQRYLIDYGFLPKTYVVDGVPGPNYGRAVQSLAKQHGYAGPIDGAPGANTSAGIVAWAAQILGQIIVAPDAPSGSSWSFWEPTGPLAARVQAGLKKKGRYSGPVDGVFGVNTRKGVQMTCAAGGGYKGPIDGVPGEQTSYAIQRYAAAWGDYTGPIDGAPRTKSWEGFALGLERP